MKDHNQSIINNLTDITALKYYVFCAYARNCFVLLLKALDIGEDDEIIMPGFTCQSICQAILDTGATPVLVDTEVGGLNISPLKIAQAITNKTKMIYIIHAFGISAQIDKISIIAKEHSLYLVEDLSHALNGTYNSRKLGSFGDFTIFSFTKTMINYQGGAVGTNDHDVYINMKKLQSSLVSSTRIYNNHVLYYFYRLLCSIWECRGSVSVLAIFKILFRIKGKKHINNLHEVNNDFFYIRRLPLLMIDNQLSKQLSEKYIKKRNNKYFKTIHKNSDRIQYPSLPKEQTGVMPNHMCGTIIKKNRIKQFLSLEIWSNTNIADELINSQQSYKSMRLFSKRLW